MKIPLVSIIIPTYNRAHIIGETLDSVIAQTHTNWECIVVDDGSTDNTNQVLKKYEKKDARIKFYKRPSNRKKGANACRNYGFELSKGEFINWLDSDDLFSLNKIKSQLDVIDLNTSNLTLITSKWERFNGRTNLLPHEHNKVIYKDYLNGLGLLKDFHSYNTFFPPHCYLVSRSLINNCEGWNESLSVNQDGEFFTRVILEASDIYHSKEGGTYYRLPLIENDNTSNVNSKVKLLNIIESWRLMDQYVNKLTKDNYKFNYESNGRRNLIKTLSFFEVFKYSHFLFKSPLGFIKYFCLKLLKK